MKRKRQNGEEMIASDLNGYTQPRSGGIPGKKGDVKTQHLLVEVKEHNNLTLDRHFEQHGDCQWKRVIAVKYPDYLMRLNGGAVEVKFTPSPMPYMVRKWWSKIRKEAMGAGKEPVLVLVKQGYAVMEQAYWEELNANP